MASLRCAAPGCLSFGNVNAQAAKAMAIHPSLSEYREVPLCRGCAEEATDTYGIDTLSFTAARVIIAKHELAMQRRAFFESFERVDVTQQVTAAA